MAHLASSMATATGREDDVATTLFGDLRGTTWTDAQIKAINKFGAEQLNRTNQGIFVFGKVRMAAENAVLLQIGETNKLVLVQNISGNVSGSKEGDKVLLVGLATGQSIVVGATSNGQPVHGWSINSRHMMKL